MTGVIIEACATPECPHAAVCRVEGDVVCSKCAPRRTIFANSLSYPGGEWRRIVRSQPDADARMIAAGVKPTPLPWKRRIDRALSGSVAIGKRGRRQPPLVSVAWFFRAKQFAVGVRGHRWRHFGSMMDKSKFYFTDLTIYLLLWTVQIKVAERRPWVRD